MQRRFGYARGGACRDHRGLSPSPPHRLLRILGRQRISGRGGAAAVVRGEVGARGLSPALTSTAAQARAGDPYAGDYARSRRCGCRGSRSTACPPWSFRDTAERRRYSARPCSKELRIAVDHVGRTGIAELLVNAGFDEFVVERVQFARAQRIAQLTD